MICTLCPRNCKAERTNESGRGFCGEGLWPRIARAARHDWEEPCISGTRGSSAVFFSGCKLRCAFCQNEEISRGKVGEGISPKRLAEIWKHLEDEGVHNINLVTAGHFIPAILEAAEIYRPGIPIVYNSSGYEKTEALAQMEGLIDIYLPDMKYIHSRVAGLLSGAPDYPQIAMEAIREMVRQTGKCVYDENGLLKRGTLVRHLVLPGLTGDSMKILSWIRDEFPEIPVSVMSQYVPMGDAKKIPGMNRRITKKEYERVMAHARILGMQGYFQDMSSAKGEYIPAFDGTGVNAKGE